jgi:hypothetical protein
MNAETTPMTAERAADDVMGRLKVLLHAAEAPDSVVTILSHSEPFRTLIRDTLNLLSTLRAPAGEPVAWERIDPAGVEPRDVMLDGVEVDYWRDRGYTLRPLYTTPPVVSSPPSEWPGEACPHDAWEEIGGSRKCADCFEWIGKASAPSPAEQGAREEWMPMDTAPRDGTLIRLLVRFTEHATEDTSEPCPTIGAWPATGDDDSAFQFAGWCWNHDHFCEGQGEPIGWLPMLAPLAAGRVGVAELVAWRDGDVHTIRRAAQELFACGPMPRQTAKALLDVAERVEAALAGPLVAGEVFGGWHEESGVFVKAADLSPAQLANPTALGWTLVYADTAKGETK